MLLSIRSRMLGVEWKSRLVKQRAGATAHLRQAAASNRILRGHSIVGTGIQYSEYCTRIQNRKLRPSHSIVFAHAVSDAEIPGSRRARLSVEPVRAQCAGPGIGTRTR
jgi:hypothetical protein